MSIHFFLPLFLVFSSYSHAELILGDTVDGVVDELRPTVNGLLQTVDKILPLGIRLKRNVELGTSVEDLVGELKPTELPDNVDIIVPVAIRLKRGLILGDTVDGLVDELRQTVNGLLGTVDKLLPLGIRLKRNANGGQSPNPPKSIEESPVNEKALPFPHDFRIYRRSSRATRVPSQSSSR